MYNIKFSSPSIISSSHNSTEIRLMLLLMIIYISTRKNKYVSYLKVCYIFSNLSKDDHNDKNLKSFISVWDPEDIRLPLIDGVNNGLWEMGIQKSKMSFFSNNLTEEIFNDILENDAFSTTREKILELSSVSNAKLSRYKLVW
ncbi:hypothetical protein EDB14_0583 [Vibrio crassostreae]|uniref:hypothetical protein n=1 Tax=Vibrio crassostreae TaxID=246167 RepID=UPI000F4FA5D6|nr:hypothetical protein [Vibrio crassostreae]RPF09527.1 hypothetical protein EDB14_0583 [Vibrio crassostreae]